MIALDTILTASPVKADAENDTFTALTNSGNDFRSALASETGADLSANKVNEVSADNTDVNKMTEASVVEAVVNEAPNTYLDVESIQTQEQVTANSFDLYELSDDSVIEDVELSAADFELCQDVSDANQAIMSAQLAGDILDTSKVSANATDQALAALDVEALDDKDNTSVTKPADNIDGMEDDALREALKASNMTSATATSLEQSVVGEIALEPESKLDATSLSEEQDTSTLAASAKPEVLDHIAGKRQHVAASTTEMAGNKLVAENADTVAIDDPASLSLEGDETSTTNKASVQAQMPSESLSLHKKVANTAHGISVHSDRVMAEARDAKIRVVSASDSIDDVNDINDMLSGDAGDALSLMVKMQNAVRSSETQGTSSSMVLASVLRHQAMSDEGSFQKLSLEPESSELSDEFLTQMSEEGVDQGEMVTEAKPMVAAAAANHASHENTMFAGLMSNVESRAAVLSGSASGTSSMSTGFSGTEGTSSDTRTMNNVFGRVELLGDDNSGNAERIHNQVMKMAARNLRQVELELYPRNLGKLRIAVSVDDGNRAAVSFTTTSKAAKELIGESMPRLKDYMSAAGMELAEQSVESATDFTSGRQHEESAGYERARQAWHHSMNNANNSANEAWFSIFGNGSDDLRSLKIAGM